ncbi:hypothetical protein JCM10207_000379 [Rhodosporidiobolus poonsookiae]
MPPLPRSIPHSSSDPSPSSTSSSSTALDSRSPSRNRKGARTGSHQRPSEDCATSSWCGICAWQSPTTTHDLDTQVGPSRRTDKRSLSRWTRFLRRSGIATDDATQEDKPRDEALTTALDNPYSSWMSLLPDSANLAELYLPGTHESLSLHFPLLGSICQTTPLTAQLRAGVRFLDLRFSLLPSSSASSSSTSARFKSKRPRIRPDRDDDERAWELWAYHGPVTQLRRAEDAFEEIYAFLESDEGRGECVVVSCKQENATPSSLFASTLWALLDTSRARPRWYDEDRWPSLGEARGKCVMFCRFGFESGRGLHPPIWPNDSPAVWTTTIGGRDAVVQDWYGLSLILDIPLKAQLALSLFSPPSASSSSPTSSTSTPSTASAPPPITAPTPFRLSFLSASSFPLAPPSWCARGLGFPAWHLGFRGVNEIFLRGLDALVRQEEQGGGGWEGWKEGEGGMVVAMDFWEAPRGREGPGELVRRVVQLNFVHGSGGGG